MKIFWKVIVAVIAFSLLGIMIVLGTAYIKSVERHTYLADNKVLSDKYVYEEFSNGKKRVKNRATQQVILDRLEWLVTGDKVVKFKECDNFKADNAEKKSLFESFKNLFKK